MFFFPKFYSPRFYAGLSNLPHSRPRFNCCCFGHVQSLLLITFLFNSAS
jgi:hypothetical protein